MDGFSRDRSQRIRRRLSADDWGDLRPVRAAWRAGARLASQLSEADLDALERLVDEMVQVSEQGDERGMVERNFAFHRSIILASHNPVLIRAWSMFQFSYWTSVVTAELHNDLVHLAQRHYVSWGLRSRDPAGAQCMEAHIIELKDELAHRKPHSVNVQPKPDLILNFKSDNIPET
jgi:DNA-binding GntR family transcriptional regulator